MSVNFTVSLYLSVAVLQCQPQCLPTTMCHSSSWFVNVTVSFNITVSVNLIICQTRTVNLTLSTSLSISLSVIQPYIDKLKFSTSMSINLFRSTSLWLSTLVYQSHIVLKHQCHSISYCQLTSLSFNFSVIQPQCFK